MKYEDLAKQLVTLLGGAENIQSSTHCVTRLRLQVKDDTAVDTKAIEALDGVLKYVEVSGQHQIVIGNHVSDVYAALSSVLGGGGVQSSAEETESTEKKGVFAAFVDIVSGIFTPILGVLAAVGMTKGLCSLILAFNWLDKTGGTYTILYTIGDSLFYFFPIILGYSAANKFGSKPYIGMTIGAALVHPAIEPLKALPQVMTFLGGTPFEVGASTDFMGVPLMLVNYTSSVIPIIFAVFLSSKVEKYWDKVIPSAIKTFFLPFLTLLVVVPVTFLFVGPVTVIFSKVVGVITIQLISLSPVITGLFVGAFWQVFVIFGLHWGIIPIGISNVMTMGQDVILPLAFGATFAQVGVVTAIMHRTKNTSLKSISFPAMVSGLFGVTEPAIYGVTLPRKRPFIISCVVSSLCGAIAGYFGTTMFAFGGIGIFAYPSFIDPTNGIGMGLYGGAIASVFGLVIGYIAMLIFGRKQDFE